MLHARTAVAASLTRAVLLAAVVALLNYALWGWFNQPVAAPDAGPRVAGLAYAPFQRWDSPAAAYTGGGFPADASLDADLAQLAAITDQIRTYSAAAMPALPRLAAAHGLRLTLGVWLDRDQANNARELAAGIRAAQTEPNVTRLIVGNETVLHRLFTPAELIEKLRQVRAAVQVPVSTAEPWHVWISHPELADHVDFITIHLLPYWEGVGIESAVDESLERLARVRARFPGKPVLIGEIGYPSGGDQIKRAVATPAAQAAFTRQFVQRAKTGKLDYFLMEAFDQPWKLAEEGRAGAFWGVFDAARQPKFAFHGPIEADAYWRAKALASSLAAFVLLVWFFSRMPNLRPLARSAFAVTAQAVLSFATVLVTLPLLQYLRAGDWLMLALLIPTSLVMVVILLAHLFEFAELFWDGSLKRRFAPRALPAGARQPFVSVHLACCNEPPAMVIATLRSLEALDYAAFEVVVVDNNTADAALWHPVRDYVATRPAHFRFFHLPLWPGYKAGALNFALQQASARAEVIAVVDADYVVRPEWLRSLTGYFDDPHTGVVQAPQAHRDWGGHLFRKMMNWEYDGFFRIGMHHRNERDAIIQHGTMTLIRAAALREHGQWSEWCMCEDAELGLRLMQQDLRTIYVDQVMGEGLTPDSFADFKKQRQRWAQGGMQIFKAHWRVLLLNRAAGTGAVPRRDWLRRAQRYHFLAGWLPWVGDALHLVFVIAALAWTAAVLAWPAVFSLPIALCMLPLAVFCAVKLVIGPLLYWRRVPCTAGGIAGAAVAGMALSHAIARGVLAGLTQRHGVFNITAKGGPAAGVRAPPLMPLPESFNRRPAPGAAARAGHWLKAALAPVREELLLLSGLVTAVLAIGISRESAQIESALWMTMLTLQALPYFAALICALAASLPETVGHRPAGATQLDAAGSR